MTLAQGLCIKLPPTFLELCCSLRLSCSICLPSAPSLQVSDLHYGLKAPPATPAPSPLSFTDISLHSSPARVIPSQRLLLEGSELTQAFSASRRNKHYQRDLPTCQAMCELLYKYLISFSKQLYLVCMYYYSNFITAGLSQDLSAISWQT